MKTKHTKGPWAIKQNSEGTWVGDGKIPVCKVSQQTNAEQFANAKLIASAPNLLICLKMAVLMLKNDGYIGHPITKMERIIKEATE